MPDGRLKLENGALLDRGPLLDKRGARCAAKRGMRVLRHEYPDTVDITGDAVEVARLVAQVTECPSLFEYCACVYSAGTERVLVIDYAH